MDDITFLIIYDLVKYEALVMVNDEFFCRWFIFYCIMLSPGLLAYTCTLSVLTLEFLTGQVLGKIQSGLSFRKDQTLAEKPDSSVHAEQFSTSEMEHK